MEIDKKNVNLLLWTSGWDSTFRLLQIILMEKKSVQPIYIVDKNRKSLKNELEAIQKIQDKIKDEFPEAIDLIQPIWFVEKENLTENDEIGFAFQQLSSMRKIGSQYEWLAQFSHHYDLKNVEISVEKNLDLNSFGNFIKQNYLEVNPSECSDKKLYYTIDTVFKYFHFPVIYLLKTEMLSIAKENNWLNIMNLTWFCHKPKNNLPCGKCNPCMATIEKGLSYRVPLTNRILGYIKIYKNKLKG
jgi:7-cyano-7-deazaguanine synthase in queuosine biosynthesis